MQPAPGGPGPATSLKRIEPHHLRALIEEDISRYPGSSSPQIQKRVAPEAPSGALRDGLRNLVPQKRIRPEGERRWCRYFPAEPVDRNAEQAR